MPRFPVVVLVCVCLVAGTPQAAEPPPETTEASVRQDDPWSLTLYSNWFLLTGLRLGHRVLDDRTEVSGMWTSASIQGCGIQAPECETGAVFSLGGRRYLTSTRFTAYAGVYLHYLNRGIRFTRRRSLVPDANLGLHWQFWSGFTMGAGYTFFVFDRDREGFNLGQQGWLHTEIGASF